MMASPFHLLIAVIYFPQYIYQSPLQGSEAFRGQLATLSFSSRNAVMECTPCSGPSRPTKQSSGRMRWGSGGRASLGLRIFGSPRLQVIRPVLSFFLVLVQAVVSLDDGWFYLFSASIHGPLLTPSINPAPRSLSLSSSSTYFPLHSLFSAPLSLTWCVTCFDQILCVTD